ncbi:MAG: UvrD-helicase domain-containing protein, partial [Lachnospiraceae bacterium]|nr:UvrD-helicase domain-containing protein [Lachnospiraceae bacterium]
MEFLRKQAEEEYIGIKDIYDTEDIESLRKKVFGFKYANLTRYKKSDGDLDKEMHEIYKVTREKAKKIFNKLGEKVNTTDFAGNYRMIKENARIIHALCDVTVKFMDALTEEKKRRGVFDFSDIEHYTLDIFVDEKTGDLTETAMDYAKNYDEIMIDEYQDSNMLQEYILNAVSGANEGMKHMFMVGDVKQSIYRFRQARPELFVEKYERFSENHGDNIKVELDKNFRSRKTVVDFANGVFEIIMKRDIGNIDYDDKASLKYGANYNDRPGFEAEMLIADAGDDIAEAAGYLSKGEKEGVLIASRIRRLIEERTMVDDRENGGKREIRFSDIAVLFRSFRDHSIAIAKVLRAQGIPVHEVSKTGYFSTIEIQTILNLVRIIDNPMQDIPLASVMHSSIGGFDDNELAAIRGASDGKKTFYEAVFEADMDSLDLKLSTKLKLFLDMLNDFRAKAKELTVYELLHYCLEKTDYLSVVTVMSYGYQRRANVSLLLEKAKEFEKTSYSGLFQFLRYVDRIIKYNLGEGEAEVSSENENAVRFITIHKSKGLEYPVVFLADAGKNINKTDKNGIMVIHPSLGIGMDYINPDRRLKAKNTLTEIIREEILKESMGEELRVLYVALTRAKEKLIITSCIDKASEKVEAWKSVIENGEFSYNKRLDAVTYMDLLGPAICSFNPDAVEIYDFDALMKIEREEYAEDRENLEDIIRESLSISENEDFYKEAKANLEYGYPYPDDINMKVKYSVSVLKHRAMDRFEEELSENRTHKLEFYPEEEKNNEQDKDTDRGTSKGPNKGALRGTAMHRAMECFDINMLVESANKSDDIKKEISRCTDEGLFDEE